MIASHDSMTPESNELSRFHQRRNASRFFGAFLSLGTVVAIGAFVYIGTAEVNSVRQERDKAEGERQLVVSQLTQAQQKLTTLNNEIAEKIKEVERLTEQNSILKNQSLELEKDIKAKQIQFDTLKQNVESLRIASIQGDAKSNIALGVAGANVFQIRATSTPTGKQSSSGPTYKFTAFIDANNETLDAISKVTYFFDHPTFKNKLMIGDDPTKKFVVSYNGWGCLDNVKVTVYFKTGQTRETTFDMCKSLDIGE